MRFLLVISWYWRLQCGSLLSSMEVAFRMDLVQQIADYLLIGETLLVAAFCGSNAHPTFGEYTNLEVFEAVLVFFLPFLHPICHAHRYLLIRMGDFVYNYADHAALSTPVSHIL